jgi:PadR family transcriptional regulator PadR
MRSGRGFANGRGGGLRKLFFLESCLLVLLHRQAGYGYSLMDGLQEFGFDTETMNISILYRALRNLEEMGLVVSSWSGESLGPQRRIYTTTPQGEAALSEWMETLRQQRREIEVLEAAYDAIKRHWNSQEGER